MKNIFTIIILVVLGACYSKTEDEAITCRGGTHVGEIYKLRTLIEVRTDYPTISYAPLSCPNMEMSFHGKQPNIYAAMMGSTANRSPGGRATFQIEAVGRLEKDKHLRIPLYTVDKVIVLSYVH